MTGTRFSSEEISFIENTIATVKSSEHRFITLETFKHFEEDDVDSLVDRLSKVEDSAHLIPGDPFISPDAGRSMWNYCPQQLKDAVCGNSDTYKEERAKLKSSTENVLIILIPLVLSALNISPQASGVAIVLSLIILKIGLNTFCETAGDLQKLRGKPGQICSATGRYMNLREGRTEIVYKGTRFPNAPEFSQWVFYEEVAEE
jgi:hypothetical protein